MRRARDGEHDARYGGEGGIRTLGTVLPYTHFPGVLLKPLGHLSEFISLPFLARPLVYRPARTSVRERSAARTGDKSVRKPPHHRLGHPNLSRQLPELAFSMKWRRGRDSNPRSTCVLNGFRDRPIQPLLHLSETFLAVPGPTIRLRSASSRPDHPGPGAQRREPTFSLLAESQGRPLRSGVAYENPPPRTRSPAPP
jgi:hypothetical protein